MHKSIKQGSLQSLFADRQQLEQYIVDRLKSFATSLDNNHAFYKGRLSPIKSLSEIVKWPLTTKEDLLVAIGPSISKRNYLIDKKTFLNFYKKNSLEEPNYSINLRNSYYSNNFSKLKNQSLIPLDLKDIAHTQLLNENIPDLNIDISNLCTYESKDDFYSWRRSKTASRQWSFISNM